ncbi:MAG TPA: bifunctional glycosyltransferase family 2/GtrA family protein [Marmoricola sp.]
MAGREIIAALVGSPADPPVLDIVIPVHNEQQQLAESVRLLLDHLSTLPWPARITIADNASTDGTEVIGRRLARHPDIRYLRLPEKGRGRALRKVWTTSECPVLVYMDVDLSTDLNALLPLVAPLISGHSDLAIGTRLARGAQVERGPRREFISRSYNLLLRGGMRARFSDAQCGFKAIRRDAARLLLPWVEDEAWFFDTELLVLAERAGLRIHEVPVDWTDDPDSSVDIVATALADLRGMMRVGRELVSGDVPLSGIARSLGRSPRSGLTHQVLSFASVGLASTVAYAVLFIGLRALMPSMLANTLALTVTAIGNTAANRRLTFGVRGREGWRRHHSQALAVFAVGLGVTTLTLLGAHALGVHNGAVETIVLTVANLAVTVGRFAAMRWWIFPTRRSGQQHRGQGTGEPGQELVA